MNAPNPASAAPTQLTLRGVLDALKADGLLTQDQIASLLMRVRADSTVHPLVSVAEMDFPHAQQPGRKLTLEALTTWLAAKVGLPYLRIDPLGMEVGKVTALIPYAYAARLKILPVKVTTLEAVIAVSDPYALEWEKELAPRIKQKLKLVLANPKDIERYSV